jgi:hypothetical protein
MPTLTTQASIKHARELSFCYFCGNGFNDQNKNCPDHVPPEAIFNVNDRNFPLKVASHLDCNNSQSKDDEVIGQLIAVIHGKQPKPENTRLKYRAYQIENTNETLFGFVNINLPSQIWRWVRGFHATLYKEFLPDDTVKAIHPPFPHGKTYVKGFDIDKILPQHRWFVEIIKKNHNINYTDKIECNNKKLLYECVWIQRNDLSWGCIFALQIYDWMKLADKHFTSRGCVGYYHPSTGCPINGTKGTALEVSFTNLEPLDPFGK